MFARALCVLAATAASLLLPAEGLAAPDRWVSAIKTSPSWAAIPCMTRVTVGIISVIGSSCDTDKDYRDPGSLPPTISVGDNVPYRTREGETKRFLVRHIRFSVDEKGLPGARDSQRTPAKSQEAICTLYETRNRPGADDGAGLSRIVIKGCQPMR